MIKDEKTALVTPAELAALAEYSMTLPTNPSVGRIWKKRGFRVVPKPAPRLEGEKMIEWLDQYWLGEAVPDPEPGFVGIKWRELLVVP